MPEERVLWFGVIQKDPGTKVLCYQHSKPQKTSDLNKKIPLWSSYEITLLPPAFVFSICPEVSHRGITEDYRTSTCELRNR